MSGTIEQIIRNEADKICKRTGYPTEYELSISASVDELATTDGRLIDIIIQAGHPPKMVVSMFLIGRTLLAEKKDIILFRDRLKRALSKLNRMDRTLGNPIPRDRALILYQDAKRWLKTRLEVITEIPDNYFSTIFTATVTDKVTGMSFAFSSDNPYEAEKEAKKRLSRIILDSESLLEFREIIESFQKPMETVSEVKSIEIQSKPNSNEVKEVIRYE